jgi:hypothetical protein
VTPATDKFTSHPVAELPCAEREDYTVSAH